MIKGGPKRARTSVVIKQEQGPPIEIGELLAEAENAKRQRADQGLNPGEKTYLENGYGGNLELFFARLVQGKTNIKMKLFDETKKTFDPKLEVYCLEVLKEIQLMLHESKQDIFPYNNKFALHRHICSNQSSPHSKNFRMDLIESYADYVSYKIILEIQSNKRRSEYELMEDKAEGDRKSQRLAASLNMAWPGTLDDEIVLLVE